MELTLVEVAGIEPASENAPRKASTGLCRDYGLICELAPGRAFANQFSLSLTSAAGKRAADASSMKCRHADLWSLNQQGVAVN